MHYYFSPVTVSMNDKQDFNPEYSGMERDGSYGGPESPAPQSARDTGITFSWEEVCHMGYALFKEYKWEEALMWLEAAFFHIPECRDIAFHLALTQARLGLIHESRTTSKTLEDAGPDCLQTRLRLCWLCLESGDLERSQQLLEPMEPSRIPSDPTNIIRLMAYIQSDQYESALAWCQETKHQSFDIQEDFHEIRSLIQSRHYATVTCRLYEVFARQLKKDPDPKVSSSHQSFASHMLTPPLRRPLTGIAHPITVKTSNQGENGSKKRRDLSRIRVESNLRKRFWMEQRLHLHDDHFPQILHDHPASAHASAKSYSVRMPVITRSSPDRARSEDAPIPPTPSSTPPTITAPYAPLPRLTARIPWEDEWLRMQLFSSSACTNSEQNTHYWVLTAADPERIVGVACLTVKSDAHGVMTADVCPLVASHRQETSLFTKVLQQSKLLGLNRIQAMAQCDSFEETIIRRNGFRMVHEEEIWDLQIAQLEPFQHRLLTHQPDQGPDVTRRFMDTDWPRIMDLIHDEPVCRQGRAADWHFPQESTLHTASLNPHLSTVLESEGKLIGVLLVKEDSDRCLHIFNKATPEASPGVQTWITGCLFKRMIPLATQRGFQNIQFKRIVDVSKTNHDMLPLNQFGQLVVSTRTFEREEINP